MVTLLKALFKLYQKELKYQYISLRNVLPDILLIYSALISSYIYVHVLLQWYLYIGEESRYELWLYVAKLN